MFKFKVEGGKTYQFKTRPAKSDGIIEVQTVDDDGNELGKSYFAEQRCSRKNREPEASEERSDIHQGSMG